MDTTVEASYCSKFAGPNIAVPSLWTRDAQVRVKRRG